MTLNEMHRVKRRYESILATINTIMRQLFNHINREVVCQRIPSMALNEIHRTEKRYEVGRVHEKQRKLTLILNKITPQNLNIYYEQVVEANIIGTVSISDFVLQIVGRAVTEQIYCETYVELCRLVYDTMPYFSNSEKRITVENLLQKECRKIFERSFSAVDEDTSKLSEEVRKDIYYKLGSVRLIGELFRKNMIQPEIMHHCIVNFLGRYENPDEENIEALCLLMSMAGKMLDNGSKSSVDIYFWKIWKLSRNRKISYRGRLMLMNCIDLRNNEWRERREIEKPKKIWELQGQLGDDSPIPFVQDVFAGRVHIGRYGSWQYQLRPPNFVRQQSSLAPLHKAERRYEVGRVFGTEDAKQRRLSSILNKLTPQNLRNLLSEVREVNIDQIITLSFLVSQIFHRALSEPTYCKVYANFCSYLLNELPVFCKDNETVTFRSLLLNKCKEEFEVDSKESEIRERCQRLGNIQFIGELCRVQVLTERTLVHCIKNLLGKNQSFDVEDVEALCKLISIVSEMIDLPSFKKHVDEFFDIMEQISTIQNLSYRIRFMLMDVIDPRKDEFQRMRKTEKPKN